MSVKIHIEGGDRRPIAMRDYMDLIDQYDYSSEEEVSQDAYERGYELGELDTKNMVSTLSKLGLIKQDDSQALTAVGRDLVDISIFDPDLFFELLHGRYSTAYYLDPSPERRISWAYHKVSEFLYNDAPIDSFTDRKQDIVDDILYKSEQDSGHGFDTDEPGAFSRKSINGYQKFIERLDPPVLENGGFALRSRCPEELILMAVDAIYQSPILAPTTEYGDLLELSDEIKEIVGVITLVDQQSLEGMFDQTAAAYDIIQLESDYRVRLRLQKEVDLGVFA